MQAYGFTQPDTIKALDAAKARGVDVEVILDRSNLKSKNSGRLDIEHHHIKVWVDSKHPIADGKNLIADGHIVKTDSHNFSVQATKNEEDCVVIDSAPLAADYKRNWLLHMQHSVKEERVDA